MVTRDESGTYFEFIWHKNGGFNWRSNDIEERGGGPGA
jgi:hypothetical protein